MHLKDVLIKSFKSAAGETYAGNDLELLNKIKRVKSIAIYAAGLTLLVLISTLSYVWVGVKASEIRKDANSRYPVGFSDKRVYLLTEIVSADVIDYQNGYVKTNIGQVKSEQKPATDVIIVFKNIDNSFKLIDEINSINVGLQTPVTYVTADYKIDESSSIILSDDHSKVLYKAYIKTMESLNTVMWQRESLKYVSLILCIMGIVVAIWLIVSAKKIQAETSLNYEPKSVLEDCDVCGPKPNTKPRASDTEKSEQYKTEETGISSAVSSEGGVFTGVVEENTKNSGEDANGK